MNIVHLSDLHYIESLNERYQHMFNKITNDIRSNFNSKIDLIIITGDLIDASEWKNFKTTIDNAYLLILELCEEFNLSNDRIIYIQGNHEVNDEAFPFASEMKNSKELYKNQYYASKIISEQLNQLKNNDVINNNFKQIEDFYRFNYDLNSGYDNVAITPFQTIYKYNFEGKKVGIVGLNSSWRAQKEVSTYGNMLIGMTQLESSLSKVNDCEIKIGLSHFPLSYLHEIERTEIENSIIKEFDIYMVGHTHTSVNSKTEHNRGKRNTCCLVTSAPSSNYKNYLSESTKYSIGYDLIEVDVTNMEVEIHHRVYCANQGEFDKNTVIAYDGVSQYKLGEAEYKKIISFRDILNEQKEEFDKLLISSTIDTIAPKNVENIFIKPILSLENDENAHSDEKELYDFDDILNGKSNVIIFGSKESGKSTILHNLFATVLHGSILTNSYPLFIDCKNSMEQKIIDKYITDTYKIGGKSVLDEIINNNDIILLIDNLNIDNTYLINSIDEFVKRHSHSRCIILSNLTLSDKIPLNFYKCKINDYISLRIRPMTISKVEKFTKIWLKPYDSNNQKLIEKIISFSKENYMPTYPIYISMLLWLSEKKNFLSYNNALLIENFVEKLLDKHNEDNSNHNNFDYKNKISVLVDIAKAISASENGYSINNHEFTQVVLSHLEDRKLPFKTSTIENLLLDSGIIIEDENSNIFFRYSSIYNYFIAESFVKDPAKLDNVLNGDKIYLDYEKIDILTALNRTRYDILDTVKERLQKEFNDLKLEVNLDLSSIDDFFKREFEISPLFSEKMTSQQTKLIKKESDKVKLDKELVAYDEHNQEHINRVSELSKLAKFERLWMLAARLIRNLDDITEIDKKIELLDLTINSCIYFVFVLNYSFFKKYIIDNESLESEDISKSNVRLIVLSFLFSPFAMETFLQLNIGSKKLEKIITEYKLQYDKGLYEQSLFKDYMINFLLIENGYIKLDDLRTFIGLSNETFIDDNIHVKLIDLYHNSSDSRSENNYLELLRQLKYKNKDRRQKESIDKSLQKLKTDKFINRTIKSKDETDIG